MGTSTTRSPTYTDDQVKQVEFLHTTVSRYYERQQKQYENLFKKVTFLFGFVASILTLYATYAAHAATSSGWKAMAQVFLILTLLCLAAALSLRKYAKPPLLNLTLNQGSYGYADKLYKDVANLNQTCVENKSPLRWLEGWTQAAIGLFVVSLFFLVLSFGMTR